MSLFDVVEPKPDPPKVQKMLAPLVMLNAKGQPVTKVQDCFMWSRLERGVGWHRASEKPVPGC